MKLEGKHYAVIAALLTGVATQLLTAQHGWSDLASPGFVAGLLIQIASAITAIFVGAPGATAALNQANKNTDLANDSIRAVLADPVDTTKVDPKRFVGLGAVLLLLALQAPGHAQPVAIDHLAQPLASEQGQSFMRGMSWATLGGGAALKTWEAWKAPNRARAVLLEAAGFTATGLTSLGLKTLVGRDRPCEPAATCAPEDPHKSFPSGHVANACYAITIGSGKAAVIAGSLLAIGTAIGRILGNRHFITDTLAGCADGLFTNWLFHRWQGA